MKLNFWFLISLLLFVSCQSENIEPEKAILRKLLLKSLLIR
jgi:hypothetical protein